MINNKFKKGLVLAMILLFIGTSFIPSTVGIIDKKITVTTFGSRGYIQGLIDNASDGDTIYIPSGIYYENIDINKSISLIGEDKNTTIIHGIEFKSVINIFADWVNISGFTIRNGTGYPYYYNAGVGLSSDNNTITGNIILNNSYGIFLFHSGYNNNISENIISNNLWGIYLKFSNGNIITGNNIANNENAGIFLEYSSNTTVTGNMMVNDGIVISGFDLEDWNTYSIDTSNTVNGKPIIYWKNKIGGEITTSVGQVILANCTEVVVKNQTINYCSVGIQLGFSSNCTIISNEIFSNLRNGVYLCASSSNIIINNNINLNKEDCILFVGSSDNNTITINNISNNNKGIGLVDSSDNIILDNNITNNNWVGIGGQSCRNNIIKSNNIINNGGFGITLVYNINNIITSNNIINNEGNSGISLMNCRNNSITSNNITNNKNNGIRIYWSSDNIVIGNNILNNLKGLTIEFASNNNTIYHNNFINNTDNALGYHLSDNIWDDGKYGNFWSDYKEKYPDAKKKIFKGIWDTPYEIEGGDNQDNYPLIRQWSKTRTRTITRNIVSFNSLFQWFLEQFPLLQKLIQQQWFKQ